MFDLVSSFGILITIIIYISNWKRNHSVIPCKKINIMYCSSVTTFMSFLLPELKTAGKKQEKQFDNSFGREMVALPRPDVA